MTTPAGDPNPTKNYKPDDDDKPLQIVAYMFAGLAMMLNIRLSYSAAPYALLRFKLPENLFSVFVRVMASSLELWCLFTMLLVNIIDLVLKGIYLCIGYEEAKDNNSSPNSIEGENLVKSSDNKKSSTIDADKLKPARQWKLGFIIGPLIVTKWLNFLNYVILWILYDPGGNTVTHKSEAITLGGSTGTLTINIPGGGAIKLSKPSMAVVIN